MVPGRNWHNLAFWLQVSIYEKPRMAVVSPVRIVSARGKEWSLTAERLPWLLGLFGASWLLLLAWCLLTPPMDNIEQLLWMGSVEWGYFKHPPLPTWIAAAASHLVPAGPPMTFVLGATCILVAHALFWHALNDAQGARAATVLLLASLCITFYNQRLHYFNHNVVMMPLIAVCVAALAQLTRRASWAGWVVIGVAMGLGMLTKYHVGIAGLCIGLWWLRMRWWRDPVHRLGLPLAALIGFLVFLPHLLWLFSHDWAPLKYAEKTSLGVSLAPTARLGHSLNWALDWLLNRSLPAWLVIGAAAWAGRRAMRGEGAFRQGEPSESTASSQPLARDFWFLWGLVPLLMMLGLGLGMGADLQMHWGTAFAMWTLPAVLMLLPRSWQLVQSKAAVKAGWIAFALVQAITMLQFWATSPRGLPSLKAGIWQHFPSQALADKLAPPARAALGGPIQIISGRSAIAGALSLKLPERPKVLINGDLATSPWITADELRTARVIEVFPALSLPPGATWAWSGWAWRLGYSPLSALQSRDVRPEGAEHPGRAKP